MSDLSVVYSRVQLLKEQPWTPPDDVVEAMRSRYKKDFGHEITDGELKVALDGVGWLLHMTSEQQLDFDEVMGVVESLLTNCQVNLGRTNFTPRTPSDMLAAASALASPPGFG